jgi:hypothetical protein
VQVYCAPPRTPAVAINSHATVMIFISGVRPNRLPQSLRAHARYD